MVVIWKNGLWNLDEDYDVLVNLQKNNPSLTMKITELNDSTYKKEVDAPISELKDYSVERNLQALGRQ